MGCLHYEARALEEGTRLKKYLRDADCDYKLNNNAVALLSRHFSLEYPQHNEFFKKRQMIDELTDPVISKAILKNALGANYWRSASSTISLTLIITQKIRR